jgi:hypothetical protein
MKKRPQRKKRRAVPVPIASMGDIAFLLIIFFMVCSEISKDKNMAVLLPLSEHVKKMETVVVARIAVDENGDIFFDGVQVDNAKDVEWGLEQCLPIPFLMINDMFSSSVIAHCQKKHSSPLSKLLPRQGASLRQ